MSLAWHDIRDHLTLSSTTFNFQRGYDAIRGAKPALKPFRDPAGLLDTLHREPADPCSKNAVLKALVEAAQAHGSASDCAVTLLLLALWPGLDAIHRRSIWRRLGTAEEVASDLLARTTEAVRGLDLGRVNWIAATVLRNVERDMIRARKREVVHQQTYSGIEPDEVTPEMMGLPRVFESNSLPRDLHRVLGADALLVIRVAIEGYSQIEVASELGLSEAAARKRFQRAMKRLRSALEKNF